MNSKTRKGTNALQFAAKQGVGPTRKPIKQVLNNFTAAELLQRSVPL